MDSGELYDLFRSDVVDDVKPYLWTDVEVFAYMNDAYFMYVRLTGGISDVSSSATSVPIVEGEAVAELHPSIMRIRQATLASDDRALRVINAQDVSTLTQEDYGVLRNLNRVSTQGQVTHMVIGREDNRCTWVQVPHEDDIAELLIERLPLVPITGRNQTFDGVGTEHHLHFMKWMRHLAYRKQDPDTFDLVKSDQEKSDFIEYCDLATREKEQRRHKVRTVAYGGL